LKITLATLAFTLTLAVGCSPSATGSTVVSYPPVKNPPVDAKKPLLVQIGGPGAGTYGCAPGKGELYVKPIKPADSKQPDTAYKGFLWVAPPVTGTANTGFVNSVTGGQEFVPACLEVKP
jgi:hypothetical protein